MLHFMMRKNVFNFASGQDLLNHRESSTMPNAKEYLTLELNPFVHPLLIIHFLCSLQGDSGGSEPGLPSSWILH